MTEAPVVISALRGIGACRAVLPASRLRMIIAIAEAYEAEKRRTKRRTPEKGGTKCGSAGPLM